MVRHKEVVIPSLCVALCIFTGSTQAAAPNNNSTPVAYIYVANTPSPNPTSYSPNQITAYAANAEGRLMPVPGSPFHEDVASMAVNGQYLLAASGNEQLINTFHIHSNGSLTFVTRTDYAMDNSHNCGGAGTIFLDHTGHSLYLQEYNIDCANSGIASYRLDSSTGMLSYLDNTITGSEYNNGNPASFIGNNIFAYAAGPSGCYIYSIPGFKRAANGLLTEFDDGAPAYLPGPPGEFRIFAPDLAAADTTSHVAITETPADPPGCMGLPVRISTWTAHASGKLTTTSNYKNMPTTEIVNPNDLKMAPSGKLVAIAGQEGLQVLHFNGANPATKYTPLLTRDPISMMFWDNANHLYAISQSANKLHVFTVTETAYHEAPGSPYRITSPDDIIVQPWPLPWMTKK